MLIHVVLGCHIVKLVRLELRLAIVSILENFALNRYGSHALHWWGQRPCFKHDIVGKEVVNACEREITGCEKSYHCALRVESVVATSEVSSPVQFDGLVEGVPGG